MSRSIFRHMLLGAALTAPLLLAGCGGDEGVPQSFPPLRYNYLAPISLNVASIQTRQGYAQAQDGTPLDAMSPESPLQGVQQMLQDRLVAGGPGGTAIITINNASINQVNDTAVGNVSLRLTVVSADGRARGYTDASVSRTRTMPDDTSEEALRAFLYSMTQDLVNAENVELEYQIRQNLPQWLVGGGPAAIGGPAAPAPVQAEPLGGPGAPMPGAPMPGAPQPLGTPMPGAPMPGAPTVGGPAPYMPQSMPGMVMPAPVPPNYQPPASMPGGDLGMPQGNPVPTGQNFSAPPQGAPSAAPGAPMPLTPPAAGPSPSYQLVPVQPNGAAGAPPAMPAPAQAPAAPPPPPPAPTTTAPGSLPPLPSNITP